MAIEPDAELARDIRRMPTSDIISAYANPKSLMSGYAVEFRELSEKYKPPHGIPEEEHQALKDRYREWMDEVIPLIEAEINRRIPIPLE